MRILGGSARQRFIKGPKTDSLIKPIQSRAKKSLFDSIRPKLTASHFLDLYAGTGSVGLEAISRGATKAVFIERGRAAIKILKQNISRLGFDSKSLLIEGDVLGSGMFIAKSKLEPGFCFDIVFSAPPYTEKERRVGILEMTNKTVELLVESNMLAPGAWVVLQHHKKEAITTWPECLRVRKDTFFGDNVLTYLEYKGTSK
ncbi:16S rRNA (guanine(966)-N(2))-methyltransferase RsmD [Elusimicrobiota bacterium]